MIKEIKTTKDENQLTVEVICEARKFAVHPIKVLTTEQVVAKLQEEYNIASVISTPKRPVGNTTRRKMKLSGVWVFQLEESKANKTVSRETKVEEPKPEPENTEPLPITEEDEEFRAEPKPKTNTGTRKRTSRGKSSLRGRISKLTNKEDQLF